MLAWLKQSSFWRGQSGYNSVVHFVIVTVKTFRTVIKVCHNFNSKIKQSAKVSHLSFECGADILFRPSEHFILPWEVCPGPCEEACGRWVQRCSGDSSKKKRKKTINSVPHIILTHWAFFYVTSNVQMSRFNNLFRTDSHISCTHAWVLATQQPLLPQQVTCLKAV